MKSALILVDIQNDFVPNGSLAVNEGDQVVPVANSLMDTHDIVVATQDWHPKTHGSFASNHVGKSVGEFIELGGLQQILWPDHCVQGTKGAEFVGGLNVAHLDKVFFKGCDVNVDSYSGFYDNGHQNDSGLAGYLKEQGVEAVTVVGLATDYCVKFTALDAAAEGFATTVVKAGCRGVEINAGDVVAAYEEMAEAGISVI